MRWRVLARRGWRAAAAPATLPKPHKSGRDRDDELARDVASYGTTSAASEKRSVPREKTRELELSKRLSIPRRRAIAARALSKRCPRAARSLPVRASALRRRIRLQSRPVAGRASLVP